MLHMNIGDRIKGVSEAGQKWAGQEFAEATSYVGETGRSSSKHGTCVHMWAGERKEFEKQK